MGQGKIVKQIERESESRIDGQDYRKRDGERAEEGSHGE